MSSFMKIVRPLAALGCVTVILTLCCRRPDGDTPATGRMDCRSLPQPVVEWHDAVQRGQELEDRMSLALRRCGAKEAAVADVIAGRLTLLEAAAEFRDLNAQIPQAKHWLAHQYPDQPYELALCRSIIRRVGLELRPRMPEQAEILIARLEAELAEHIHRHGRVCLPVPGSKGRP
jgi:hypothetical protein